MSILLDNNSQFFSQMGQTQYTDTRTPFRQGFTPLRKTPLRSLSADITLYHRGSTFLAHTTYPLDPKSHQLLLENEQYYARRATIAHPHLFTVNSYDIVEESSGGSMKGGRWGEDGGGRRTNVNAPCSLSIFQQYCRKNTLGAPSLKLHLYHEYQGHTLQSQIEMRKQCQVYFQEEEMWTILAACASAGEALIQGGLKEPLLSPSGIKIDCNGSYKIGEWEFSHFYQEIGEDEEETNFFQEGEMFLRPASSRLAAKSHHKKAYNILTNYYWAPQGTSGLQNIVTLGRKLSIPSHSTKSNQIFSLGMTLLHLCLMRPLYQGETFSEKKINAYLKQAMTIRKSQGMPLSNELLGIMKRMLAWDAQQRIDYSQLAHQVTTRNSQSMLTSENQTPAQSGTCRSKLNPTKSLLLVEGKDSGSIVQGFGDMTHPLEQSQKMNLPPCTTRQECSLNYEKIDFTIRRQRREWERFENRIQEDSYKVRPSVAHCNRQLFPSASASKFTFPAQILMQDGQDNGNHQSLSAAGMGNTNQRQKFDIQSDANCDINLTNSIEQSIKLLDISNIKAQDDTKEISKQRHSFIRAQTANDSLSNLFAENKNTNINLSASKEDSLLLKSSVSPLQPHNNQKQESIFTPPELLALIRESAYASQVRKGRQHPQQHTVNLPSYEPQMIASEVALPLDGTGTILAELSNSIFVKESFAKGYYQGGKVDGLRSGYGTFYYRQGGKYCGDWENNQMHGKGTLYYSDGRIAYQGDWSHDSLKGKGILYNQKPVKLETPYDYSNFDHSEECWVYYEGNFHEDDKWGRGVLQLSNGERFEGSFRNDLVDGRGVFYTMQGTRVIGEWSQNQLVRVIKEEEASGQSGRGRQTHMGLQSL